MLARAPLASSLQSFETCLFLVGLDRYPSALVSCATAWESALKAKLAIGPEKTLTLEKMLMDIRSRYDPLRIYDDNKLGTFRTTRNRLVHFGFSPKDDQKCAMLLLETGLPFLNLCYRVLFDFYLDWREIRPENKEFNSLSPAEMAKVGLFPEVAEQLRFVKEIYRHAKKLSDLDYTSCFSTFIHFIRLGLKESARAKAEWKIIEQADTHGLKFEHEEKAKEEIEKLYYASWRFDRPICYGFESMVAELEFDVNDVRTDRCACVQCGFVVGKGAPYISQVLLAEGIVKDRAKIFKEFGMEQRG